MKDNKLICSVSTDPMTVLLLGAFPAIAATGTVKGALAMGLTVTVIMIFSGAVVSLLRNSLTEKMLLPVSAALSCFLAAAAGMLLNAWFSGAYSDLGVYVSLLAAALMIYGNANFAYGKIPGAAAKYSLQTGIFYTAVLAAVAVVRELIGSGSFFGLEIGFMKSLVWSVLAQPAGGFMVYAFAAAAVQKIFADSKKAEKSKEAA